MILKNISIRQFRNYSKLDLDLNDKINIIYGSNGEGKTNILESIYVLALTKSHRSFIDNNLIKEYLWMNYQKYFSLIKIIL